MQWQIQGKGPGGSAPLYFETKMRPGGPTTFFLRPGPPLSQGLDDRPPSYLKVWIRHWYQYVSAPRTLPFCITGHGILTTNALAW